MTKAELKRLIKASGLKIKAVADKIGYSESHMYALTCGNARITTETAQKIKELLK